MKRIIFLLLIISSSIFGNVVMEEKWKTGETFTSYLKKNDISLDILKSLDELEKQVIGEIRGGQVFYEVKDDNGKLIKAYIPISSTLQIKLAKDKSDQFKFSIIPINFKEDIYFGNVTIKNNIWNDITSQTNNSKLTKKLQIALRYFSSKISKGDSVAFLYSQKSLFGYLTDSPTVYVIKIAKTNKDIFVYVDEDGNGHDEPFETISYVTDKPIIGKQITRKVEERSSGTTSSKFIYPVRNPRITSPFSYGRYHPVLHIYRPHFGTDFGLKRGTPVMAIGDGVVIFTGYDGGYGKVLKIQHAGGYVSLYAHLDGFRANVGDRVSSGDVIAFSGNTGTSSGPHLHLGVYLDGTPIDPMSVISKESSPIDFILDKVTDAITTQTYETKKVAIPNAIKYKEMLISRINNGTPTYEWSSDNGGREKISEDDLE